MRLSIDLNALPDTPVRGTPDGRLRFKRKLGEGAEGRVYLAVPTVEKSGRRTSAGRKVSRPVAVKVISGDAYGKYRQMRGLWSTLRHPNIVSTRRVLWDLARARAFVEMEWCDWDLHQLVSHSGGLGEGIAARYASHVAVALAHCHQHGIAHGDVKPENVLIRRDIDVAKLCDFGSAVALRSGKVDTESRCLKDMEDDTPTFFGSPFYTAPEVEGVVGSLDRGKGGQQIDRIKSDMWSLGVLIFTSVAGHAPWAFASEADPKFRRFLAGGESFFPSQFSPGLKALLSKLLSVEASFRPSAADVCHDSWITNTTSSLTSPLLCRASPSPVPAATLGSLPWPVEAGATGWGLEKEEEVHLTPSVPATSSATVTPFIMEKGNATPEALQLETWGGTQPQIPELALSPRNVARGIEGSGAGRSATRPPQSLPVSPVQKQKRRPSLTQTGSTGQDEDGAHSTDCNMQPLKISRRIDPLAVRRGAPLSADKFLPRP
ncbi:unnamed protein product [Discosporangium mesarthrocarpum]